MSKAGENIRELATQRRSDAMKRFGIAVITGSRACCVVKLNTLFYPK